MMIVEDKMNARLEALAENEICPNCGHHHSSDYNHNEQDGGEDEH